MADGYPGAGRNSPSLRGPKNGNSPKPSGRIRAACGFLLLGSLFVAPALPQGDSCEICHEDTSLTSPVHGGLSCSACHSNISGFPHEETDPSSLPGGSICAQCHESAAGTLAESVHADLMACGDCHGEGHSLLDIADLASPVSPLKQIQLCSRCHDEPALVDSYLNSVHGRALIVSGLINAPSCSDCHSPHGILPPSVDGSSVSHGRIPSTCGSCHQYLLDSWQGQSAHGQAWQKQEEGPVCSTCHSSHAVMAPRETDQRLKFPETCGGCHGDRYLTYRDSFHGKVTDLGFRTAAICSDCHTPHLNLPAEDPRSTIHPANLATTCGKCHGPVSPAFLTFEAHNHPSDPSDNFNIFLVWAFMTALLMGVFGFFGVHDFLWFQRSLVACVRREETRADEDQGGQYIRRFQSADVWLHIVIIMSFLILAATGLPLKFHFAGWAAPLAGALGGIGSTRFLHRLAALVTFGYAVFHLSGLIRQVAIQRDFRLLWGWRSMIPRGQDFKDLWANLRYFLYWGPRPSFDRWTYWEKFDYFAVFWGVLIIGFSGLVLWFPAWSTLVVPGWVLNAAYVIHSDEALLAVGFIFLFHFFHTHLRPESFPLDPVIFTGVMSLERFKRERPIEYERLLKEGDLGQYLAPPPSSRALLWGKVFGLGSVAVGLILMLAILWGFLAY